MGNDLRSQLELSHRESPSPPLQSFRTEAGAALSWRGPAGVLALRKAPPRVPGSPSAGGPWPRLPCAALHVAPRCPAGGVGAAVLDSGFSGGWPRRDCGSLCSVAFLLAKLFHQQNCLQKQSTLVPESLSFRFPSALSRTVIMC